MNHHPSTQQEIDDFWARYGAKQYVVREDGMIDTVTAVHFNETTLNDYEVFDLPPLPFDDLSLRARWTRFSDASRIANLHFAVYNTAEHDVYSNHYLQGDMPTHKPYHRPNRVIWDSYGLFDHDTLFPPP